MNKDLCKKPMVNADKKTRERLATLKNIRRFIFFNDPETADYVDEIIAKIEGRINK